LSAHQIEILRTDPVVATAHKEAQVLRNPPKIPDGCRIRHSFTHPVASRDASAGGDAPRNQSFLADSLLV